MSTLTLIPFPGSDTERQPQGQARRIQEALREWHLNTVQASAGILLGRMDKTDDNLVAAAAMRHRARRGPGPR